MDETQLCDVFIYSTLSNDSTLVALLDPPPASLGTRQSIYFDMVPQDVETVRILPVVIVRHMPPREDDDSLGNAGVRWSTFIRLRIVANAATENYDGLSAVADRIDELLHLARDSAGKILKFQRLAPYRRAYFDGKEFREVGGDYLVQVSQFT